MKIRLDFVTNSSSSSYVTVTINLKSNEHIDIQFDECGEWHEQEMPDYINGTPIKGKEHLLKDNISSMYELVDRLICSADLYYEEDIPEKLLPLIYDTYHNPDNAKELYEKMFGEVDLVNEEYENYDDGFFEWVRENVIGEPDAILDATKNINDVSEVSSIHVSKLDLVRESEMDVVNDDRDSWEFLDDDHARRELEYNYTFGNDSIDNNSPEKEGNGLIQFEGKRFVTTGLSAGDERWVKEQVESKGGEYKPKFVVSLDYLIINPEYDHETVKLTRTKEQIEKGKDVKIITYDDFKKMV